MHTIQKEIYVSPRGEEVPPDIIYSLRLWEVEGIEPGSFLKAVLENDLTTACSRADMHNQRLLFDIVCFCYNKLSYDCWGSRERVMAWEGTANQSDQRAE